MTLDLSWPQTQQRYARWIAEQNTRCAQQVFVLAQQLELPVSESEAEALLQQHPALQQAMAHWLDTVFGAELLHALAQIEQAKQASHCHQCGLCCQVATQSDDFETLQQKAQQGDTFAQEFVRVFRPYGSVNEVQERFPEIVAQLQQQQAQAEALHYYYCQHLEEATGKCLLWGKPERPAMCERYPEQPLVFIQNRCGWASWKSEYHDDTLRVHAGLAVADFWLEKAALTQS